MENAMDAGRSARIASKVSYSSSCPTFCSTPLSFAVTSGPIPLNDVMDGVYGDQRPRPRPHRALSLSTIPLPANAHHARPPSYTDRTPPKSPDRLTQGDSGASPSESCPTLTGRIQWLSDGPVYPGTYSRVYRGRYCGQEVAVKVIRSLPGDPLRAIRRRFRREQSASRFNHHNILRIHGIIEADWCEYGCIVTPWCQNGDAFNYVRRANLGFPETYQLLYGVGAGLEYLHGLLVVHGDIKPGNILIDAVGNPLITDFGLMCQLDPERPNDVIENTTTPHNGTIRYLAYELVEPYPPEPCSMASDIHALGCVCYALIYLVEPYAWRLDNKGGHIFRDIAAGKPPAYRPEPPLRPPHLAALWDLMQGCWDQEPPRRPTITAVRAELKILAEQG